MRALRITLIVLGVLAGLFVAVDLIAVNYVEGKTADKVREREGLDRDPEVSIKGFPFLTQALGGTFDEVEIAMEDYRTENQGPEGKGPDTILLDHFRATLHKVKFAADRSSATAERASGTATIGYPELLKAAQVEPMNLAPGVTANVVSLSNGGDGRIRVEVSATLFGQKLPEPVVVMSTVKVKDDTLLVHADALPSIPVDVAEDKVRGITDFQQPVNDLPEGIHLDKVEPVEDGVEVSVTGSDVKLGQ